MEERLMNEFQFYFFNIETIISQMSQISSQF